MTKKEFISMAMQKDWDKETGKRMWEAGRGDAEIAKSMGVTQATISYFRRKHWEPSRELAGEDGKANEERNEAVIVAPVQPQYLPTIPQEDAMPKAEQTDAPVPDEKQSETPIQKVTIPDPPKPEDPDTGYQQLIRALEEATSNLTGMDAVMTAQIITALWHWKDGSDLMEAKACLDYLIRRHEA